jgi:hypothetical protein
MAHRFTAPSSDCPRPIEDNGSFFAYEAGGEVEDYWASNRTRDGDIYAAASLPSEMHRGA